jgi:hypothetical protein
MEIQNGYKQYLAQPDFLQLFLEMGSGFQRLHHAQE